MKGGKKMEKNNEKVLKRVFMVIVGLIVVVGIASFIFWGSNPTKIVDGFDCSKHQEEIVSLCNEEQNCDVLNECMESYDENQLLVVYAINDSQINISEIKE